jgi:quinoprotein glucose dehydrogenase
MISIRFLVILSLLVIGVFGGCQGNLNISPKEWSIYGGSKKNNRFAPLYQITKENVKQLSKVWEFQSGDADRNTQIQTNPILVNGTLYSVSPKLKLIALEPTSGKSKWIFDPFNLEHEKERGYFSMNVCRGVTYFDDGNNGRILYGAGSFLYAVDAQTGKLIDAFGQNGKIDLHENLGRPADDLYVALTTPGIIYKNLIIIGTRVDEGSRAAPGYIRAYNAFTGSIEWVFHTIPQPGEEGYSSWENPNAWQFIGGANAWSGFSLDEERGLLFAPLGSASFDFYGGNRKGDNLYANSLVALDAATGKRVWHYQTVHHDVWDRDLPTAPVLAELNQNGKRIPAVIQPTKSGFIFVFHRETGVPIFKIEEKEVPQNSPLFGEQLSKTQPIPVLPKPFVRQSFDSNHINPLIPKKSQDSIQTVLDSIDSYHMFAPPSPQGTLIFPGYDGGAEWGGPAFNPNNNILFLNANEMPWILTMVPKAHVSNGKETLRLTGERLYSSHCMVCHGKNKEGSDHSPSLLFINKNLTKDSLLSLLDSGRRMMPAFNYLTLEEKEAITSYILSLENENEPFKGTEISTPSPLDLPFVSTGYNKFKSPEGYPAIAPPWGTLNAIDMNTGELKWKVPLGEIEAFSKKGILTGSENYGGPIVTPTGILFIAATPDGKIRAFDQENGTLLWEDQLPFPGYATPILYEIKGKPYLVIACGGGKLGSPSGDRYVAYSLP